jgi:uncharacterized damage-inducible protein DinB
VRKSIFADAFAHHVWATLRLIDVCLPLSPAQLETAVQGTYGSILKTLRHFVEGDGSYLFGITGDRAYLVDEDHLELPEVRAVMERYGAAWSRLLAQDLDPDTVFTEHDDDGYERDAPLGIRLAQALDHGTDHRSQICTTLTTLGVKPPDIDVWAFGASAGRIVERWPASQEH